MYINHQLNMVHKYYTSDKEYVYCNWGIDGLYNGYFLSSVSTYTNNGNYPSYIYNTSIIPNIQH
jgi:hypothetical protein